MVVPGFRCSVHEARAILAAYTRTTWRCLGCGRKGAFKASEIGITRDGAVHFKENGSRCGDMIEETVTE
jgi:hypothetical protein